MESGGGCGGVLAARFRVSGGERQSPQTGWNQTDGSALAEADQKFTSAHIGRMKIGGMRIDEMKIVDLKIDGVKIDGVKIDGLRWLSRPGQSNIPPTVTRGSETNIRVCTGQGAVRGQTDSDQTGLNQGK